MKIEDCKNIFEQKFNQVNFDKVSTDSVYKFLSINHVKDVCYSTILRMVPFEPAKISELEQSAVFNKLYDIKYDIFYLEWEKHLLAYWNEKMELLNMYTSKVNSAEITPMQIYKELNKLMIKIEKRSLIVNNEFSIVDQKHRRENGNVKDYILLRANWISDTGQKSRLINRQVANKFQNLEQEVIKVFHNKGFNVEFNNSSNNQKFDFIINRGNMKIAVDIKINNISFYKFFMFNEFINQFESEYGKK